MLNLTLNRQKETEDSLFGELLGRRNAYFCCTLENLEKAIPAGVYEIRMQWSNRFERIMPFLQNVPGREAIEIHPANKAKELLGCIAPGYVANELFLSKSRIASDDLNILLQLAADNKERITITINDIPDES